MLYCTPVGSLVHPVAVNPEYRGCRMDAWGRNASFQLAALHATVRALQSTARVLREPSDPRWTEVAERLPLYQTITGPSHREAADDVNERIALWQGQDLEASHRHHSH